MSDAPTPMLALFHEDRCIGFLLARGPAGTEAFTACLQSLGVFPTRDKAAAAIAESEAA